MAQGNPELGHAFGPTEWGELLADGSFIPGPSIPEMSSKFKGQIPAFPYPQGPLAFAQRRLAFNFQLSTFNSLSLSLSVRFASSVAWRHQELECQLMDDMNCSKVEYYRFQMQMFSVMARLGKGAALSPNSMTTLRAYGTVRHGV